MENYFCWSEIGSGFEEPGSTPPPKIPRSTPPPPIQLMKKMGDKKEEHTRSLKILLHFLWKRQCLFIFKSRSIKGRLVIKTLLSGVKFRSYNTEKKKRNPLLVYYSCTEIWRVIACLITHQIFCNSHTEGEVKNRSFRLLSSTSSVQ